MKEVVSLTEEEILRLSKLLEEMKGSTIKEKLEYLEAKFPIPSQFQEILQPAHFQEKLVIHSILAVKQENLVFCDLTKIEEISDKFQKLVDELYEVELFYGPIGGIIGYHLTVLKLLLENQSEGVRSDHEEFLKPPGIDLSKLNAKIRFYIRKGLENFSQFCEIYPVGGAGDRLSLKDEETQEPLPAALLTYKGKTLLEGLIRDLQGREYLYYKLFGKQILTPIALMTSVEKHNHEHILAICHKNNWFGRGIDNFFLFQQPMVPMLSIKGEWALREPLEPILKPGGHGVIWKAAQDAGVFQKLYLKKRMKALIRQINNPIAGIDYNLTAFLGYGSHLQYKFGFASCPRQVNTAEGMDILIEKQTPEGASYCLTNLEYTDFAKKGIVDEPESPGDIHSIYPANTNILYADLRAIELVLKNLTIPGMMINTKSVVECLESSGKMQKTNAARLESLMQNIADGLANHFSHRLKKFDHVHLQTFLTYSDRRKTISVTKKLHKEGDPITETPDGAYYDYYLNNYDLFKNTCAFDLPPIHSEKKYLEQGPSVFFNYLPALGPFYTIIGQKIRGGKIAEGSEISLEITEVWIEDLSLEGSLVIECDFPYGGMSDTQLILYGENSGKCRLKNVFVKNAGIDLEASKPYWKGIYRRKESLQIQIQGKGEFVAENVIFKGDYQIIVPDGIRMTAVQNEEGSIIFMTEEIDQPTWKWRYAFDKEDYIVLKPEFSS